MNVRADQLLKRLPSANQIIADMYGVEWKGNKAKCPRATRHAHGDRNPSFVFLDRENRLHCYSQQCFGPTPVDVIDFVGQMDGCTFVEALNRLVRRYAPDLAMNGTPKQRRRLRREELHQEGFKVVAEYSMGLDVRKVRLEHSERLQTEKEHPEKTFCWEHRAADGSWKNGCGGKVHQAYTNEVFLDHVPVESILGVESERSADAVGKFGIPGFSFKELTEENAVAFLGLSIVLLPDRDEAGKKIVNKAVNLLKPHAKNISLIEPPSDWPKGGDIYDAITDLNWTKARTESLLATARPIGGGKSIGDPINNTLWTLSSLRRAILPAKETIIEDILAAGDTIGIVGRPKAGKSRLAQQLALHVSRGQDYLGHRVPKARKVLVLDLENRASGVRTRFQKMSQACEHDDNLYVFAPETLAEAGISLATETGLKALQDLVAKVKPDLLIIDTWRLLLGGDENKPEVVVRALRALSTLRVCAPSLGLLIVHHTRKTQGPAPPRLRTDPSAWMENASGHHALIAHMDACFGLEREFINGDDLIVFGGVARSSVPRTLLLEEDPETLLYRTSEGAAVAEKLLTEKERQAWQAIRGRSKFTFTEAIEAANTTNRKMIASMLRKLTDMNVLAKDADGTYRFAASGTCGTRSC